MAASRSDDDNTTPSPPVSTPSKTGPDWAMQAFMDLKVSVVSMETNIKALTEKVSELKDEQSKVKSKLSTVEKQLYAAAVVMAIVCYVGNKAIDFGMDMAKRSVYSQPAPAMLQPQQMPQPQPQLIQQAPPSSNQAR